MAGAFLFVFFMMAAYFAAIFILLNVTPLDFSGPARYVIASVSGIVLMMGWLFLYIRWIDYYLDVWILTDERIVQFKQNSLFNRQTAGFDLATIQDVASRQQGVVGTFFNYGTIFVQTAATTELFKFTYIPKPFDIKRLVLNAQDKLEYEAKTELGKIVSGRKANRPGKAIDSNKDPKPDSSKVEPITPDQEKIIKKGFPGIQ